MKRFFYTSDNHVIKPIVIFSFITIEKSSKSEKQRNTLTINALYLKTTKKLHNRRKLLKDNLI